MVAKLSLTCTSPMRGEGFTGNTSKFFAGDTAEGISFLTEPADEQSVPIGAIKAHNVNRSFAFG
jgi:hypothetical protein